MRDKPPTAERDLLGSLLWGGFILAAGYIAIVAGVKILAIMGG